MNRVTKRAREIPPFIVMDILEKAHELERQGRDIIHLEIGEPDFPTPECPDNRVILPFSTSVNPSSPVAFIIELK